MVYLYRETQSAISSCYRRQCCTVLCSSYDTHSSTNGSPNLLLACCGFWHSTICWTNYFYHPNAFECRVSLYKYTISCLPSYLMVNSVRICRFWDIIAISWLYDHLKTIIIYRFCYPNFWREKNKGHFGARSIDRFKTKICRKTILRYI
jgi:hypothetical protein